MGVLGSNQSPGVMSVSWGQFRSPGVKVGEVSLVSLGSVQVFWDQRGCPKVSI